MRQEQHERPFTQRQGNRPAEGLTIQQTATGYWTVQREGKDVAGSMTRGAPKPSAS